MGVNMAGFGICDDDVVCKASEQEIIRRYYKSMCAVTQGLASQSEVSKIETLMTQLGISSDDRPVVKAAADKSEQTGAPAVALELNDGRIVTGKTSSLLGSSAACLLNALKTLADIDDDKLLISPQVIEPIQKLKLGHMGNRNPRLHTDEILIALSICAVTDPDAQKAMEQLSKLKNTEGHSTVILSHVDENIFNKLGVNMTCEPKYQTKKLYHR